MVKRGRGRDGEKRVGRMGPEGWETEGGLLTLSVDHGMGEVHFCRSGTTFEDSIEGGTVVVELGEPEGEGGFVGVVEAGGRVDLGEVAGGGRAGGRGRRGGFFGGGGGVGRVGIIGSWRVGSFSF